MISGLKPSWIGTAWVRGGITRPTRIEGAGGRSLPHCFAERTEQEGVFYSNLVFIGTLRHIAHVTARPVTYGVSL